MHNSEDRAFELILQLLREVGGSVEALREVLRQGLRDEAEERTQAIERACARINEAIATAEANAKGDGVPRFEGLEAKIEDVLATLTEHQHALTGKDGDLARVENKVSIIWKAGVAVVLFLMFVVRTWVGVEIKDRIDSRNQPVIEHRQGDKDWHRRKTRDREKTSGTVE